MFQDDFFVEKTGNAQGGCVGEGFGDRPIGGVIDGGKDPVVSAGRDGKWAN